MRHPLLSTVAAFLLLSGTASAATKTVEMTVAAGKHDRHNVPVCVPVTLPEEFAGIKHVPLQGTETPHALAQLTAPSLDSEAKPAEKGSINRELHFIVPTLKADSTLTIKAIFDTSKPEPKISPEGAFSWHDTKGESTELRLGDKPVMRYMYKALDDSTKEKRFATFKVYHHLFDPAGSRPISKGDVDGLYPHHRGIFYGFKTVTYEDKNDKKQTVDIWHCTDQTYQGHDKFLAEEAGAVLGRHRVQIGWHGKDKELFATEERELTVYNTPGGRLVEFTSRLTPVKGIVKLDGDPQHSGFHFRAAQDVAEKAAQEETYFVRPDGVGDKGQKGTRNWDPKTMKGPVNLPWNAMCFVIDKKRYTVAYLDKPTNPKEARFSEREYGRIGSYFVTEVTPKKPLTVNYRLWLQEGEMKPADVAELSEAFVDPVKVTVDP